MALAQPRSALMWLLPVSSGEEDGRMGIPRSYCLATARIAATVALTALVLAWGANGMPAAAESTAVPTLAQLQDALLTPSNLPASMRFQEIPLPPATGVTSFAPCPFAAEGPQPFEEADASYSAGTTGTDVVTVTESLEQYSVGNAKKALTQFAAFATACSNLSFKFLGLTLSLDIARELFPSFGNGTVALRMVTRIVNDDDLLIDTDLVAVRYGGTVIVITNTATAPPGSQLFSGTLTRIAVAAAYKKVTALW
jgi:hypothetical protein